MCSGYIRAFEMFSGDGLLAHDEHDKNSFSGLGFHPFCWRAESFGSVELNFMNIDLPIEVKYTGGFLGRS